MGSTIDPRAAATAAMEAAAAAEAAARAAAEAAANEADTTAASTRTTSVSGATSGTTAGATGLGTSIGERAVADTGAGLPGGGILEDGAFADVADRDLSGLATGGPAGNDSLLSLPGLDGAMLGSRTSSAADILGGAMDRFDLDGGGSETGATMGKGMIMDDADPWSAAIAPLVGSSSGGSSPAGSGGSSGGGATTGGAGSGGSGGAGGSDAAGSSGTSGSSASSGSPSSGGASGGSAGGAGGSAGTDDGTDWGAVWDQVKAGVTRDALAEGAAKQWHDSWVGSAVDWVVDAVSGDGEDDDSTDTSAGGGSGAGTSVEYQTEDQAGTTRPKGWVDPDDILTAFGRQSTSGVVSGSRGGNPDAGDDGFGTRPGPQGGDTTVNPGSEGTYAQHIADRGASLGTAVDWVGQPKPGGDKVALDPSQLETIDPGPGPEVINPGDGQAADSEVQASTAYAGDASSETASNGYEAAPDDPSQAWDQVHGHSGKHSQGEDHRHQTADEEDGLMSATDAADVPEEA